MANVACLTLVELKKYGDKIEGDYFLIMNQIQETCNVPYRVHCVEKTSLMHPKGVIVGSI